MIIYDRLVPSNVLGKTLYLLGVQKLLAHTFSTCIDF